MATFKWEDSEFPILCETCLGDNPYIRMTKEKFGKECKICSRPFTVFRWCPGSRMRFKKTEVCQTCSKQKNVCQTCLLDLEYGLPVQVRDYAMNLKDEIPRSEVNREYYSQNMEREDLLSSLTLSLIAIVILSLFLKGCSATFNLCGDINQMLGAIHLYPTWNLDSNLYEAEESCIDDLECKVMQLKREKNVANTDGTVAFGALGKTQNPSDLLMKLARTTPYYKRNRPHICSFWVKGECKRGEECPYRHEKPTDPDDPLADQNIKDRYYGANDPVADKYFRRVAAMPKLRPPQEKIITTLYVGNLDWKITEKELKDHFYQYGEIRSITLLTKQQCAFIQFTTRTAAELAAEKAFNKLILCGRRLTIKWGRSQAKISSSGVKESETKNLEPVPGLPDALPAPPEELANNYFNLAPTPLVIAPPMPPYPPPLAMLRGPPPIGMGFTIPPPLPFIRQRAIPQSITMPPGLRPPGSYPPPPLDTPSSKTSTSTSDDSTTTVKPAIHYPSQDPQRMGSSGASKA